MKVKVKVQYCVMCKLIRIEYTKRADLTMKILDIRGSIVFFPGRVCSGSTLYLLYGSKRKEGVLYLSVTHS